jgi:hypothetical protein
MSPTGTVVPLIDAGTFTGQRPGGTATFTFDESALTPIGGSSLVSGTFNPTGDLNHFIGEIGNGNWVLNFRDTAAADPLSINAFSVTINTSNAIPEPASILGLMSIGLLGLAGKFGKKAVAFRGAGG